MTQETPNNSDKDDTPLPTWAVAVLPVYIGLMFIVFLFPISQDWLWLEAWLFIITFDANLSIGFYLMNKKNPRVLRNRMKTKKVGITEKTKKAAGSDKYIMIPLSIGFLGAFILPAVDYLNQWTLIPFPVEIIGLILMNIGVIILNIAMLQNAYASKILDINKDQKLIDTGLYGHVRHPLYSGAILMILGLPIALGSWISLIPAVVGALSLIVRIKFEEEMLIKGMDGYEDYRTRVRYKIIPKIY